MRKFEYKISPDESTSVKELERQLNKLGEEGWELAGIKTSADTTDTQFIFKKEKPRDDFGQKPRFDKPRNDFKQKPRFDKPRGSFSSAGKHFGSDKPKRNIDGDEPKPKFEKTRTFTPKDKNFSDRKPHKDRY